MAFDTLLDWNLYRKYGLSFEGCPIVDAHMRAAILAHNLVIRYFEEHPDEWIGRDWDRWYYDTLAKAERLYDVQVPSFQSIEDGTTAGDRLTAGMVGLAYSWRREPYWTEERIETACGVQRLDWKEPKCG